MTYIGASDFIIYNTFQYNNNIYFFSNSTNKQMSGSRAHLCNRICVQSNMTRMKYAYFPTYAIYFSATPSIMPTELFRTKCSRGKCLCFSS